MANNNGSAASPAQGQVAYIACGGFAAGKARFFGWESCAAAAESGFERGECRYGCVGVGDCVKACTKGAMALEGASVKILADKCDGCGDCLPACPQSIIRLIPQNATNFIPCSSRDGDEDRVRAVCGYGCIACGECERACPEGAVKVTENRAVIDYDKCIGCAACTVSCRKKIIIDTYHDLRELKPEAAFVRCSGDGRINAAAAAAGASTCSEAARLAQSGEVCSWGCFGFGDCTAVCRFDAIKVENGAAKIDADKCVGCRDCMRACPRSLIVAAPYQGTKLIPCASRTPSRELCSAGCTGCGDCASNCPNGAIYFGEAGIAIDPEKCDDCGICQYVCQYDVVRRREVPEYIYLQRAALGLVKS